MIIYYGSNLKWPVGLAYWGRNFMGQVKTVIEKPHNDHLPLIEASRYYMETVANVAISGVVLRLTLRSKSLMNICFTLLTLIKLVA
ncbi:hypothetical protein Q3G72_024939 [Acer saccharum]|nr:hypothetical protein Q3G72_024939 [Acer saccharum]